MKIYTEEFIARFIHPMWVHAKFLLTTN